MNNTIVVTKSVDFDDIVLGNIIVDGFLSCGYSFAKAQCAAESILGNEAEFNKYTGAKITKEKLIRAIQRYCSGNTDIEIEHCSDNARDIITSII